MSAAQLLQHEESENLSDSDSSATAESSNEWPEEKDFETAILLDQKIRLPKELCDNNDIFNELFSLSTWSELNDEEKSRLTSLLPKFPEDQEEEQQKTVEQLFNNEFSRFGDTPLNKFFNNLQDGNYRPDIAHYRKQILRAEKREQRLHECERISALTEELILSRDKLLRSACKRPTEASLSSRKLQKSNMLTGATVRAKKRFHHELAKMSNDLNLPLSDDDEDVIQDAPFNEMETNAPDPGEIRFMGTLSQNKKMKANRPVSDGLYKQMLKRHQKQKLLNAKNPEMDTSDIKVKDILSRTNISKKSLKKADNNNSIKAAKVKNSKIIYHQEKLQRVQSDTDEEDWIKANIIKIDPEDAKAKKPQQILKTKAADGNIIINRKRAIMDNEQSRTGKKIIINSGGVVKTSFVTKNFKQVSRPVALDVMESSQGADLKIIESPELKSPKQSCFLSLIRNIFCSTPDHRMKLEELRRRINVWLKNPAASENTWFKDGHWSNLLISAVHFLSGEFSDQPDAFVPYLEFKSHLNIYQWIGAGRDSDVRMVNLNQYWLSRQNDMGIRNKTKFKPVTNPENNEENFLLNAVPPSRSHTSWKVRPSSKEEISHFQQQEKKRFETPFKSFTYREHEYESVVGPIRSAHLSQTSIARTRDNNVLKSDRPSFVTTTALVRDAIARLPNGEGSRAEIGELLKSSQYIQHHIFDTALHAIVESALNILCAETEDPCVKFDSKKKIWIYLHRNRSMMEFERIHQMLNKKRMIGKRVESEEVKAAENRQKIRIQSSPPPLKITAPNRLIKHVQNEPFDAEASLDAIDPKPSRITLKNVQQIPSLSKVTTIIGQKKIIGKPIMINQGQGSPTVSISGHTLTPVSVANLPSTSKIMTATSATTQGKNIIKLQNANVRVTKPQIQQKIILTAAASAQNKTGKIITFPRNSTPMLSQQKQILTNVVVQQQKAKSGQNQILLTTNSQQKVPSLTISSPGTSMASSASPQQRQAILQLKQLKESAPTTVVLKPQLKDQTSIVGVNKLIRTSISPQQVTKAGPEVSTARLVSNIGTTFKLAQIGGSQGNIIQMTCVPQSSTSLAKITTTQATGTPIVSTSTAQNILLTNSNQTTTATPTIKLQSGSFTAQQLLNAKFINVQTLNNKGIKTAGGIKMVNAQGYTRLPNVPIIITGNKNLATNQGTGQSIVLQANPNSTGAFILNPQNQLKVQGNILTHGNILNNQTISTSQPQTVVLGNQVLKVQSLNANGPSTSEKAENKPATVGSNQIILGSTLKVLKNVIKAPNAQQPTRVVLTSPSNSSQPMQQIILPANFQGLKTLQGIKVIQQARLIPSTLSNPSDTKTSTPSNQEKE